MKFTDALKVAYQTPWSYVNTFDVWWAFNPSLLHNPTIIGKGGAAFNADYDDDAKAGNVLGWNPAVDNERMSLHLISIQLPQVSYADMDSYAGGRKAFASGKANDYTFSMTFRDSNQLEFYRMWTTQLREQQYRYFEDYMFNVHVTKDSDYGDRYHNDTTGKARDSWRASPLVSLKRCAVQSVSGIDFSHSTDNQIVEFTVSCIACDIEIRDSGARQFYEYLAHKNRGANIWKNYNDYQNLIKEK